MRLSIEDILESIARIEEYTRDLDEEGFSRSQHDQDAVLRRIEIIGEAVKNLPDMFKQKHPKIPWKNIAGMRDIISHSYFGVNMSRVWKAVRDDLPPLKKELEKIASGKGRKLGAKPGRNAHPAPDKRSESM